MPAWTCPTCGRQFGRTKQSHECAPAVGIFFKRARTFAELRPMQRWVALSFSLPRRVAHRTITKKVVSYRGRYFHIANLRGPEDVDDDIRSWLTEAYLNSPD